MRFRWAAICFVVCCIIGCGQTGPLFLPTTPQQEEAPHGNDQVS